MHTLIVEPDDHAQSLGQSLERHGHDVRIVPTGEHSRSHLHWADLVLLEVELPDMDGVRLCQEISSEQSAAVIITSKRTDEVDKVLGLQAGSDDYLVKPFGIRELLARIEAVMRRVRRRGHHHAVIEHGLLRVDPVRHEVHVGDRRVQITRKEFSLLHLLASAPDRVFSRARIMSEIWNDDWTASRTIDTHVSTLRRKLGSSDWIVTVRGVGIRLGSIPPSCVLSGDRSRLELVEGGVAGNAMAGSGG